MASGHDECGCVVLIVGVAIWWVWQLCCKALFCCVVSSPFLVFLCFIL